MIVFPFVNGTIHDRILQPTLYTQDSGPLSRGWCSLLGRICIRTDIPAGPNIARFCYVRHTIACWPEDVQRPPRSWGLIVVDSALCAIRHVFSVTLCAINSSHHFIICTQSHCVWHDISIHSGFWPRRGICHPREPGPFELCWAQFAVGMLGTSSFF